MAKKLFGKQEEDPFAPQVLKAKKGRSKNVFKRRLSLVIDPVTHKMLCCFSRSDEALELFVLKNLPELRVSGKLIQIKKPLNKRLYNKLKWSEYPAILEYVEIAIPESDLWIIGYWNLDGISEHAVQIAYSFQEAGQYLNTRFPGREITRNTGNDQWEVWVEGGGRPAGVLVNVEISALQKTEGKAEIEAAVRERAYLGLHRCEVCGQYKGVYFQTWANGIGDVPISCICEGVLCPRCKVNKVRRPISNYWDEGKHGLWHVPYFGLHKCRQCERW